MKRLRIADKLSLPLETVTQTFGILAKRRAGKSYAARRLAEQLFKAGQQIVVIDPKGDQWGIRSAADGVSPGLPVVILGGERADVPLEVHSGEVVAKLVVEERVSVLIDLSLFRKHEVATFMSAFLENLYRLKAREIYRTPMMLIVDEADAIAPQKPMKGEERMLGAAEDIVRRGGQRGIGCALITQRSAVINKNVLTQVQILVTLRTIAPQDLAAVDAWIDVHGTEEERKMLKSSLPSLPTGDAWFWSPGWPTADGIFQRVHTILAVPLIGCNPLAQKRGIAWE
jgi:DNA helicase HerA-like ATPase